MSKRFYTNSQVVGDHILAREIVDGERRKVRIPYQPTLYVPAKRGVKTEFTTISGKYLEPIKPGTIRECRQWLKKYDAIENFEVYGNTYYQYTWIADEYPEERLEYDINLISIWTLDIEAESENGFPKAEHAAERINLISMEHFNTGKVYAFGLGPYTPKKPNVTYYEFETETELLEAFLQFWAKVAPDIVTGWNVSIFDVPYIIHRCNQLFDEETTRKMLSPWGRIKQGRTYIKGREFVKYEILGVAVLDYLLLYQKYVLEPRESYKLDYIAEVELGDRKIQHDQYEKFSDFYKQDWEGFVDYNIQDNDLVKRLDDKLQLIALALTVAYRAKVNYEDVLSQVRSWDTILYNQLRQRNVAIPMKDLQGKDEQYEGAFVKEPVVGLHKWVVALDVRSLYPSLILVLNIGSETKDSDELIPGITPEAMLERSAKFAEAIAEAHRRGVTLSSNGVNYSKDRVSFYAEAIETLFADRLKNVDLEEAATRALESCTDAGEKKRLKDEAKKYELIQKALKILMNSLYGALGNEFFRYFDIDNAEAITKTGKFLILFVERGINAYLNKLLGTTDVKYVVYCDTDSAYIELDGLVQKVFPNGASTDKIVAMLDKFCKRDIAAELDRIFKDLCENHINGMKPEHLKMVREIIADKGIWVGKKHYMLNVLDKKGVRYSEPKLKVVGLEMVKGSTPKFCRDYMKDSAKLIMKGSQEELWTLIKKVRAEFMGKKPEEIAFPKSVNGLEEYAHPKTLYKPKTPINTKAALVYNLLVRKKGLDKKYQYIMEGEKIKYIYLIEPNPTREKVVAFIQTLPPEFDLHRFIDYNTQFEKTFLNPVKAIVDVIGWTTEKRSSLEDFFA